MKSYLTYFVVIISLSDIFGIAILLKLRTLFTIHVSRTLTFTVIIYFLHKIFDKKFGNQANCPMGLDQYLGNGQRKESKI